MVTTEDLERLKREILEELFLRLDRSPQGLKYLKSSEIRKLFHISETKLYELRRDGKIPFLKVDGKYLYEYSEVIKSFKTQTDAK